LKGVWGKLSAIAALRHIDVLAVRRGHQKFSPIYTPCGKVQAVQNAIFGESCIRKRGSYPKAKKESLKRKSFPQSASPFSSAYPLFPTQVKTRKSAWQKGLRVFHSFHGPYYYYY
jgi:hypothetical protein